MNPSFPVSRLGLPWWDKGCVWESSLLNLGTAGGVPGSDSHTKGLLLERHQRPDDVTLCLSGWSSALSL